TRITQIVGEIKTMFSELIEDMIGFLGNLWNEVKEWIEENHTINDSDMEEIVNKAVAMYKSQFDKISV
ncbi:unnamed protein product, partial [marine sediment metagenome]